MCKLQYKVFDVVEEETKFIQLLDWLGVPRQADFTKARFLGRVIGVLLMGLFIGLIASTLFQFGMAVTGFDGFEKAAEKHAAIRNTGLIVAAIIGVPFIIWRAAVAQKQVDVAEQSHITDRISKAVEQLGATRTVKKQRVNSAGKRVFENGDDGKPDLKKPLYEDTTEPNLEVRLGGIYGLERISKDSEADHIQIMEILCAYVRENATALAALQSEETTTATKPTTDVQTVLTVIGRRRQNRIRYEQSQKIADSAVGYRLDLRETCLQGVDLTGLEFQNVILSGSTLHGASLNGANLQGARLYRANLQEAWLDGANLQGAWLYCANLQGASLNGANLQKAWLDDANLQTAWLDDANLQEARLYGANLQKAWLNGANLQKAWLNDAKLQGAWLNGANLSETDFTGANTSLAAVKSTSLHTSKNLTQKQVTAMFGDETTILPDGIKPGSTWPKGEQDILEFDVLWRAAKAKAGLP